MSLEIGNEALIVQYLLGVLPAGERRRLERLYFLDDRLFESVCSVEEQLIRDFLRGELPTEQGQRFAMRYMQTPQLSKKVEAARLLMQAVDAARPEQVSIAANAAGRRSTSGAAFLVGLREFFRPPAGVFGFAAAGLAAAALPIMVWLGLDNRQLRTELARSEAQRRSLDARLQVREATPKGKPVVSGDVLPERAKPESGLAGEVRAYAAKAMRAAPLAFVLSSGATRGEAVGRQRLIIPAQGVDRVRLSLDFTPFEQYAAYRVIVSSVDGGEVSSQDLSGKNLVSESKLVIEVPAVGLRDGDYIVVVKGGSGASAYEDLDSYYFHVARGSATR
jgi:hypothetical protein